MLKNTLKIVFLGVVGFGLLVYLTAEKPQIIKTNESLISTLSLENFPQNFVLVGLDNLVSKDKLFEAKKTLLVVGNHDSLSIVKDLKKYFTIDLPYVMVANISNAPWFIKKWAIPGKLEELNKNTNIPMIYDDNGFVVKSLNLTDISKTKYFAYIVESNGNITKLYTGNVKEDAMNGTMNDVEIKKSLYPLVELLK